MGSQKNYSGGNRGGDGLNVIEWMGYKEKSGTGAGSFRNNEGEETARVTSPGGGTTKKKHPFPEAKRLEGKRMQP